jgi:hypothetical protein
MHNPLDIIKADAIKLAKEKMRGDEVEFYGPFQDEATEFVMPSVKRRKSDVPEGSADWQTFYNYYGYL